MIYAQLAPTRTDRRNEINVFYSVSYMYTSVENYYAALQQRQHRSCHAGRWALSHRRMQRAGGGASYTTDLEQEWIGVN